jgi:PAS domain-containing protein
VPDLDFRVLFEAAPGILLVLAPDAPRYTMLAASDERLAATQSTREETIGRGVFEVFTDDPANPRATGVKNLRASLDTVLRTRAPHRMAVQRYDLGRPDGTFEERHWAPLNVPILGPDGAVRHIIHHVEDVTARVRAERAAHDCARRLGGIFESVTDAVVMFDRDWRYTFVNQRAAELLRRRPEELLGRNVWEVFPGAASGRSTRRTAARCASRRPSMRRR